MQWSGFAETASIARFYAVQKRQSWNPSQEFIGQGVANVTSGLFGGLPVGGSFSRSSVAVLAGAKTRLAGAVTGLTVLAVLPLHDVLAPLPKAVLAAIVIAAVVPLVQFRKLSRLHHYAQSQAWVDWGTFIITLLLTPRVDYALLLGIVLAIGIHLWREMRLNVSQNLNEDTLCLELNGVLWFGSVPKAEDIFRLLIPPPQGVRRLVLDADGLGRLDVSGAMMLARILHEARSLGLEAQVIGLQPHMARLLQRVKQSES